MTQPNLPFDIPWLNDYERDYAFRLTNDLFTLCRQRNHIPNALTIERIRLIILTDATANRLEARLAAQLDQPSQRVSGAQVNATTIARQRHARALDDFEVTYPKPAPEPAETETAKPSPMPYGHSQQYRDRVTEVMERMAPELEPFEDPVVTTYFMEKECGRKFHYELPKEAYTDIIRKPQVGGPIDPITREPMILMQYRARQAKWDEIRRLKAEAQGKEAPPNQDDLSAPRSQVALGIALVPEAKLPPDPQGDDDAPPSQVALGNKENKTSEDTNKEEAVAQGKEAPPNQDDLSASRSQVALGNALVSEAELPPHPQVDAPPTPRLRPWQQPPRQAPRNDARPPG